MPRLRASALLAAAVVVGALVGFGVARGQALIVLSGAGLRLRGLPEFVTPDRSVTASVVLGALHAVLLGGAWGTLGGALAVWLRGWRGVLALAALAAAIAALDPALPAALRLAAGGLAAAQRTLCAIALAAAAGIGVRLVATRDV